jgi:small conductance mechanosensitive channel
MRAFQLILLVLFSAQVALAQEPASEQGQEPATVVELPELPAEIAAEFDARLAEIAERKRIVDQLAERLGKSEGVFADVIGARMDGVWTKMFDDTVTLARDVAAKRDKGFEVSALIDVLTEDLRVFPERAIETMDRLRADVVFPTADLEPHEIVIADQQLLNAIRKVDAVLKALIIYLEIADTLGLDMAAERNYLIESLEDSAANRSVFLQLAIENVAVTRAAMAALPGDSAMISTAAVTEARIKVASRSLQEMIALMVKMKLEVSQYRQQVLVATGELTADVLDVGVVAGLIKEWTRLLAKLAVTKGPQLVFQLIIVFMILFVFGRLSRVVQRLAQKALASSKIRLSALLNEMAVATARNLVIVLGVLIALSQIGVSLGPLLAGLGIAGFIIGFALQGTLSNFASGMLILIYRPFDVGDFVEAGGVMGTVSHMSIVNTTFKTIDNQLLIVPNNMVWSSVITNVTAQRTRRVDLKITVSYSDDLNKVEQVLNSIIDSHDAVLDEPAPVIKLHELGDSGVMFVVRPWVKTEDYWPTYWDLLRAVKDRFDEEGITHPFPQHDVHVMKS